MKEKSTNLNFIKKCDENLLIAKKILFIKKKILEKKKISETKNFIFELIQKVGKGEEKDEMNKKTKEIFTEINENQNYKIPEFLTCRISFVRIQIFFYFSKSERT